MNRSYHEVTNLYLPKRHSAGELVDPNMTSKVHINGGTDNLNMKKSEVDNSSQESLPSVTTATEQITSNGILTSAINTHSRTQSDTTNIASSTTNIASSGGQYDKTETSSVDLEVATIDLERPVNGQHERSQTPGSDRSSKVKYKSEKKKRIWHNVQTALSPTYKSKSQDFKKVFKDLPSDERLVADFSCALQKDILVHGRLYITQKWICFYANIFRWETVLTIPCKDIISVTKEKTALVIPNAIQIATKSDKYFFTSFTSRDKAYIMLFRMWQNALLEQPMTSQELWQWVHLEYGDDLGLHSSDDDYIAPISGEDLEKSSEQEKDNLDPDTAAEAVEELGQDMTSSFDATSGIADISTGASMKSSACVLEKVSSLDNPDLPTDVTDNEESEGIVLELKRPVNTFSPIRKDDVVFCECVHDRHSEYLNEVYTVSVDAMFTLLFGDSQFLKDLYDRRKTVDVEFFPWPDSSNEDGNKDRAITYTLALNHTLGPKSSPVTEKQIIYSQSVPGECYIIDCECYNSGIPYSDSFYVVNRYCITRMSTNKCRLAVHSEVKYKKNVWGIAKSFIQKNCIQGIKDYFDNLAICIRSECNIKTPGGALGETAHRKKVLRRRRGHSVRAEDKSSTSLLQDANHTPTKQIYIPKVTVQTKQVLPVNLDIVVRVMCIILILLVLFNAILFYKLWYLEDVASQIRSPGRLNIDIKQQPKTLEDWSTLLQQQHYLHNEELQRWRKVLSTSVLLMDQMKAALIELQRNVDLHEEKFGNRNTVEH